MNNKNSAATSEHIQVLEDQLLPLLNSPNCKIKASSNYLIVSSDNESIKIRHSKGNSNLLITQTIDGHENTLQLDKQVFVNYLIENGQLTQVQWSAWKKFERLSHSEMPTSLLKHKILVDLLRDNLIKTYGNNASHIDVIISQNTNNSIYLIFNKGLDTRPIRNYFVAGFLSDKSIIHNCIQSDIREFVFWDGITSSNKRIKLEELLYMLDS